MQMILEQHPAALRQSARAKRLANFVGTIGSVVQLLPHALSGGARSLGLRHVITDRIQQTIEILVIHDCALNVFCSNRRVRCSVTATVIEDIPKALAISG